MIFLAVGISSAQTFAVDNPNKPTTKISQETPKFEYTAANLVSLTLPTFRTTPKVAKNAPVDDFNSQNDVIMDIISFIFGKQANLALKIARCESGLDPLVINTKDAKITGHNSYGIFQINGYFKNWDDPKTNILKAKEIYDKQGFNAWKTCYNKIK